MKRIKPSNDNREIIYKDILKEIKKYPAMWLEDIAMDEKMWSLQKTNYAFANKSLRFWYTNISLALAKYLENTPDEAEQHFNCAMSYGLVGLQLNYLTWKKCLDENDEDEKPYWTNIKDLQAIWGLSCHLGLHHIVEDSASRLLNIVEDDTAPETLKDEDPKFYAFLHTLLRAYVDKKWPENVGKELGEFAPLFTQAHYSEKFKQALEDYCDHRWTNVYGYDNIHAEKRRSVNDIEFSVFDCTQTHTFWHTLIPYDLFALKYVYKYITGKELNLECTHPTLTNGWLNLPKFEEITFDERLTQLKEICDAELGKEWFDPKLV